MEVVRDRLYSGRPRPQPFHLNYGVQAPVRRLAACVAEMDMRDAILGAVSSDAPLPTDGFRACDLYPIDGMQ